MRQNSTWGKWLLGKQRNVPLDAPAAGLESALRQRVVVVLRACARPLAITAVLVVANGMSGTVFALAAGAQLKGFFLALLLSAWSAGMLTGALVAVYGAARLSPRALAIAGSTTAALASLMLAGTDRQLWLIARFAQGVGAIWVFVACETWLGTTSSRIRPLGFAVYLVVNLVGLAIGQVGAGLSLSASLLLCAGAYLLLPMLAPKTSKILTTSSPGQSFRFVTTAWCLLAALASGLFVGTALGPGPLYAESIQPASAGAFVACLVLFGLTLQVPAAYAGRVLGAERMLGLAAALLIGAGLFWELKSAASLYPIVACMGAGGFILYPLAAGAALEKAAAEHRSRASAELLLVYGVGAFVAPFLVAAIGNRVPTMMVIVGLVAGAPLLGHGRVVTWRPRPSPRLLPADRCQLQD